MMKVKTSHEQSSRNLEKRSDIDQWRRMVVAKLLVWFGFGCSVFPIILADDDDDDNDDQVYQLTG